MWTANIGPPAKISRSGICHVNDNFQYNYRCRADWYDFRQQRHGILIS